MQLTLLGFLQSSTSATDAGTEFLTQQFRTGA